MATLLGSFKGFSPPICIPVVISVDTHGLNNDPPDHCLQRTRCRPFKSHPELEYVIRKSGDPDGT